MLDFLDVLYEISLEAAPWLVFGLFISGLIRAWLPQDLLVRQLGGAGFGSIFKAALIGAPLPLCSCSVIPVALGIRRAGASKSATSSFLVSTPETGADSITLSWAMLGPFLAIVRPVSAILTAISAGLLVRWWVREDTAPPPDDTETQSSCCGSKQEQAPVGFVRKTWDGLVYSVNDIYANLIKWLVIGLLLAAMVRYFMPPDLLASWGSGLPAMMLMVMIGVPMYICATASTPLAASLLLAGMSPGTVLVFLLAGPATNFATIMVVKTELGKAALAAYLTAVIGGALAAGLVTDWLVRGWSIDVVAQADHAHSMIPEGVAITALVVLTAVALWIYLPQMLQSGNTAADSCCSDDLTADQ